MSDVYAPQLKTLEFANGKTAQVLETLPTISAHDVCDWLNLPTFRFCVSVHGGAMALPPEEHSAIVAFLRDGLIRFAQDNQVLVTDGGTDTGVNKILGQAYSEAKATFPLVGVTVRGAVTYPNETPPSGAEVFALNSDHSHFVVVDANDFGTESYILVGMARARGNYGVALAINGGGIVRAEIEMQARLGTPVITLKGTGRYADDLAEASIYSNLREPFISNATTLKVFDIRTQAPEDLYRMIRSLLLR